MKILYRYTTVDYRVFSGCKQKDTQTELHQPSKTVRDTCKQPHETQ
jgi:hypothetical protein